MQIITKVNDRPRDNKMRRPVLSRRTMIQSVGCGLVAGDVTLKRAVADEVKSPGVSNILYYGADPTGSADSAPALNLAATVGLPANGGAIYIPPGIFRLGSQINLPGKSYTIFGNGPNVSVLKVNHQNTGILFAPSSPTTSFRAADIGFAGCGPSGSPQCAFSAQFPSNQQQATPSLWLENVDFAVQLAGANNFYSAFQASNIWRSVFKTLSFHGPGSKVSGSSAVTIGGFSIDPRFEDLTVDSYDVPVQVTASMQGLHLINPVIGGCNRGIVTGQSPFDQKSTVNVLGLYISGGEFGCSSTALSLYNVNSAFISDCHFGSFTTGPTALLSGCFAVQMSNCQISGANTGVGLQLEPSANNVCDDNTFDNMKFMNLSTAAVFGPGAMNNSIRATGMVNIQAFPNFQVSSVVIDQNGASSTNQAEWDTGQSGAARYQYLR